MKHFFNAIALLWFHAIALSQPSGGTTMLKTNDARKFYYVYLNNTEATVYSMKPYLDKTKSGYLILATDKLTLQPDGSYEGKTSTIINENAKMFLIARQKKTRKFSLDTVRNGYAPDLNLNNTYYLDSYFKVSDDLSWAYPLYRYEYKDGIRAWENLQNKDLPHEQFREFVDQSMQKLRDSVTRELDKYVALTNYITWNIKTLRYDELKDSLTKLSLTYTYGNKYYDAAANEVARERPDYFFKLAEDLPGSRHKLFLAIKENKIVIRGLKEVEGHDVVKKEFFKQRTSNKTTQYATIGAYVVGAALLGLARGY